MAKFFLDSSTLISLSETCSTCALGFLKEETKSEFFITSTVVEEIVGHPIHVMKYAFSAFRLKKLLRKGIVCVYDSASLQDETKKVLEQANSVLRVGGVPLNLMHSGEAECLAAMKLSGVKNFFVDEKTTRLLIESPSMLAENLRTEYAGEVKLDEQALSSLCKGLENAVLLRSTELLAASFKKGFFDDYGVEKADAFHSALYALQAAGCSISSRELKEYEEVF